MFRIDRVRFAHVGGELVPSGFPIWIGRQLVAFSINLDSPMLNLSEEVAFFGRIEDAGEWFAELLRAAIPLGSLAHC